MTVAEERAPFDDFYRAAYPWAVRLGYGLTGDAHLAEELAQDVFARMSGRYPSVEHPIAYLRVGIVNAARSHGRRARLERLHLGAPLPDPSVPTYLVEFADALNRLPAQQRMAVVLRYLEGLDDETTADLLGCRRSTVRSLVARGLAALREVMPDD